VEILASLDDPKSSKVDKALACRHFRAAAFEDREAPAQEMATKANLARSEALQADIPVQYS
jgi:hypothetical protein